MNTNTHGEIHEYIKWKEVMLYMIKGFYSGSYKMSIPFSNWDNFDKILDLIDDYIELKEQINENNVQKTIALNRI